MAAMTGSTSERGYGWEHQQARKVWEAKIATGTVACSLCGKPIGPTEPWDLDHTDDGLGYRGPSHPEAATAHRR
jgi:hypothetical protein